MFSTSVLPGVSTNIKFMHNPPSKPSNRYVKSSTNPNVSYLSNPSLYDLGYMPILTTEGPPATWYPNSSYNPSYGQDYAIYSTPASNAFTYDQSTQFLDFGETSIVSPSMSTASLETLKSPVDAEYLIDELGVPGSENRVIQTGFPFPITSSHGSTIGRTLSAHPVSGDLISGQHFSNVRSASLQHVTGDMHQTPRALHPSYPNDFNDDCQSTISELEVEERDRIAKMNAEYNAISLPGSLNNSPSPPKYSPDRFRESNPTYQLSSMQTRPYIPLSVSQPRHPDLHFPQRQLGNEKKEPSPPPYRIYASPVVSIPQDLSPPSVERVPSQLPLEQNVITIKPPPQSQSSPPVSSRNYEGTSDLDRPRIAVSSPTTYIQASPQTGHPGNVGQSSLSGVERGQTLESSSAIPAEITRKSRSPVVIATAHSFQPLGGDIQESKPQSRPGAPILIQPSTTAKNHPPYNNTSPDSRQYTDVVTSSPHAQINKATELESTERISLGSNLRKDTRTPGLSGKVPSTIQPDQGSQSTSSQDDNSSDMRHKSSPKGFFDEKAGYLDNGRSPADSLSSSDSSFSSVSPSNRPPLHEDVSRLKNYDKEFERHRRQRSHGTERTPVPKFIDETSRGTAPMHTQGPLHLSPEGALATFLPDPQVVSIVTSSEHKPTDLRHSKTVYDQASIPIPLSRESRKVHDRQYVNFAKPHAETTKYEGNDMRIQISPVNKFPMTSSSLPSKVTLDFPPTTAPPEPHRRRSDGDQVGPPIRPPLYGRNSAPMVRSVRWTENLVAPSPILAPPRRKGWFNRRGDQLWTNNGDYRPPQTGDEYPLDLNDYPEIGDGWMNEDGVRIDMTHCRIPKALPRPALKKP